MGHQRGTVHDHPSAGQERAGDAALADLLDLDGQVLNAYWADVTSWVRRAAGSAAHSRILDIGAGTGTGAIALAQRFAGAEVVAVDVSEEMLGRIRTKALNLGLAGRVRTVRADLDLGWPAVEGVDITWASMSLHHFADPDRVLYDLFAATRAGGLMAVAEMDEQLRFLPDDIGFGRAGLEARCLDALRLEHADTVPELGSDWPSRLAAAGFTVLEERPFAVRLDPPLPAGTARYARLWMQRLGEGLADRLAPDDVATLAALVDGDGPGSLLRRNDLRVRGSRTVTLARRP